MATNCPHFTSDFVVSGDTHRDTDTHVAFQRHMVSHRRHYVIAVVYTVSFNLLFPPRPRIWPSAQRGGVLTCSASRHEPHRLNLVSAWAQQEAGVCGVNRYTSVSFLQVLWTRSHFSRTKQVSLQWPTFNSPLQCPLVAMLIMITYLGFTTYLKLC